MSTATVLVISSPGPSGAPEGQKRLNRILRYYGAWGGNQGRWCCWNICDTPTMIRLRKLKLHRKSDVELMEPELLLQLQSPSLSLLVHRLEDTTSKFRKVDLGSYRLLACFDCLFACALLSVLS